MTAQLPKKVIETFSKPDSFGFDHIAKDDAPKVWNGEVSVLRYRVTIEEIEEPEEIVAARLRKLWRECDNAHHFGPLRAVAKSLGVDLRSEELGVDRKPWRQIP